MPVNPPRPVLPPLNGLRAFEAAARLGGFAAAAAELRVTPGAVTQHIRQLEAYFGAELFERHAKGVRLTPLGQLVRPRFTEAFDQLGAAVQVTRAGAASGHVHIATLPSIAQLWLSPRLPAIRAARPGMEISVTALEAPPNLRREPYDLSLFYLADPPPGAITLARDVIFPVAAPAIAEAVADGAPLESFPQLSDSAWPDDWALWSAHAGHAPPTRGPAYSLYALAVEEAVNGAGILIAHAALVARDLGRGALVRLPGPALALDRFLVLSSAHDLTRPGAVSDLAQALVAASKEHGPVET